LLFGYELFYQDTLLVLCTIFDEVPSEQVECRIAIASASK
jgi:hypothetical protein